MCPEKAAKNNFDFRLGTGKLLFNIGRVQVKKTVEPFVEISQGNSFFHGKGIESPNKKYLGIFQDGYGKIVGDKKLWVSGAACVIENDNLIWFREFERPWNLALSDNGITVVVHSKASDSTENIKPAPGKLGEHINIIDQSEEEIKGRINIIDKSGHDLMSKSFTSNVEACAISSDGKLAFVATLSPDDSIYCLNSDKKKLIWKYENHARKVVLGLSFEDNIIGVMTGSTISSMSIEYELNLNGTLVTKYVQELEKISKIKTQPVEQSIDSLLTLLDSNNRNDICNALVQLQSIAYNKKSLTYYQKIVQHLKQHLQTKDKDIFDLLWKVIRVILRKNPTNLDEIISEILLCLNQMHDKYNDPKLFYLNELGAVNPKWIEHELPSVINTLKTSERWNDRRFAAFVIGSVGSKSPGLVQNAILTLIEYVKFPEKTTQNVERLGGFVMPGVDPGTWLRDASIDALGDIGGADPETVKNVIPLLEELSKNASTPYSMEKAQKALKKINSKPS